MIDSIGLGLHFRASQMLKPATVADAASTYILDSLAPTVAKSGAEVVEVLMGLWQESEFVSLEGGLADSDVAALKLLKKVFGRDHNIWTYYYSTHV